MLGSRRARRKTGQESGSSGAAAAESLQGDSEDNGVFGWMLGFISGPPPSGGKRDRGSVDVGGERKGSEVSEMSGEGVREGGPGELLAGNAANRTARTGNRAGSEMGDRNPPLSAVPGAGPLARSAPAGSTTERVTSSNSGAKERAAAGAAASSSARRGSAPSGPASRDSDDASVEESDDILRLDDFLMASSAVNVANGSDQNAISGSEGEGSKEDTVFGGGVSDDLFGTSDLGREKGKDAGLGERDLGEEDLVERDFLIVKEI